MAKKKDGRINNGGARKGAGRRPVRDKAVQVSIYIKKSKIAKIGGLEKAQRIAKSAIDNHPITA